MQSAGRKAMISVIYAGTERGEEPRNSSPRGSNPYVAITVRRLDQGGGEGSAGYGPPRKSNVGRPEEVHLCSSLLSDDEKEKLQLALLSNIDVFNPAIPTE